MSNIVRAMTVERESGDEGKTRLSRRTTARRSSKKKQRQQQKEASSFEKEDLKAHKNKQMGYNRRLKTSDKSGVKRTREPLRTRA